MTTKHTPGPWVVINGPCDDYENGAAEIVADDGAKSIAIILQDHDAALIAAAPELLTLLIKVNQMANDGEIVACDNATTAKGKNMFSAIRAAIAKAEGRE